MRYGLIGEHLGHSFSRIVHSQIADYEYELCEIAPSELDSFMTRREFCAINVTIPYKQAVIPYLDFVSEQAREIGAVNTVVNKDGKLYGYNTDFYGMKSLIDNAGIELENKKVLILGSGGTSRTAMAVANGFGAREIYRVSRSGKDGCIDYSEAYRLHSDADVVINTTPVGMLPKTDGIPIELDRLPSLSGVVDAVYNPIRTRLVVEAREKNIAAHGGLYMLVAQAVRACEIFLDKELPRDTSDRIFKKLMSEKESIVLVGMPACGKTTIGKLLAERTGREFYDLDEEIVKYTGRDIPEIFANDGEKAFRDIESKVLFETLAHKGGAVIATGGGAVLRGENVRALRQNGKLYFLNRPLCQLMPTADRPTASTKEAIEKRYNERLPIYKKVADVELLTDGVAENTATEIIKIHFNNEEQQ